MANALFTTYELLEMVLLHLPIHDLLDVRAVDKTFLAVIGRSQKLQRSLYLLADSTQGPSGVPPVLNGLLGMADPRLEPWRLKLHGHAANGDGTYDYGLFYDLDDDYYSRAKALTTCEGFTGPGLWQTLDQPSQSAAMAPKTPKQALEQHAARLAEDLLTSRHLVKTYQPRHHQRRKLPITGSLLHAILERLQRVDTLACKVFNTYELLEMILLSVPIQDLLLASRVNKTFKTMIDRSQNIQLALYLRPETQKATSERELTLNGLWYRHPDLQDGPWTFMDLDHHDGHVDYIFNLDDVYLGRADLIAPCNYNGPVPSWRKMHVARPLPQSIRVYLKSHDDEALSGQRDLGGDIAVGNIQEALRSMFNETIASDQWPEYIDDVDRLRAQARFIGDYDRVWNVAGTHDEIFEAEENWC
ncbi:hypothetical protein LTR15_010032 [Elasticomyces elasticus]|nr:hypothetical protein LTR15_010032 [Elasticomyces elasticus]